MKRLFLLLLLIAFLQICTFSPAGANESTIYNPIISGKTATLTYGGHQYAMAFYQGPFGPMESGDVDITVDGAYWKTLPYYFDDSANMVKIDGLADFKYLAGNLVWSQGELLIFQISS